MNVERPGGQLEPLVSQQLPESVNLMRNFFADGAEFSSPDSAVLRKLIDAYSRSARKAAASARYAISSGGAERMRSAQWDEAVCSTIERALCIFMHTNTDIDQGLKAAEEFDLPESPDFDG